MKRWKTFFAGSFGFLSITIYSCVTLAQPPEITAKSAIVIEASTGKVLFEKDAEKRRPPASTTKMMTLITALEHGNLEDMVTASQKAAETEGSTLWLAPGEKLKMLDLLYGVMLVSGNDATVAVAEHIAGSAEKFAGLMTAKAKAIGAMNTNFVNTSGLPDPNHYSTAHDLAKIAAYGYKKPLFTMIISTERKIMPWQGKEHDRDLYNENKLIWLYDGANGVKTGYTDEAGRCLVSGAKRKGVQIIAVVLDSEHMWDDSMAILDYGFSQVRSQQYFQQGDVVSTVRVRNGWKEFIPVAVKESLDVPVFSDGLSGYRTEIDVPGRLEAPISAGQKVGAVKVFYQDQEVTSLDLVAKEMVERKSLLAAVWGSLRELLAMLLRRLA